MLKFTVKEGYVEGDFPFGDVPISSDSNLGILPTELLAASIASCSGLVFRSILKKQRINVDTVTIDVNMIQNANEANRVKKVILTYNVKGKNLHERKLLNSLLLTKKYCTVVRSIEKSIEVEKKLVILPH